MRLITLLQRTESKHIWNIQFVLSTFLSPPNQKRSEPEVLAFRPNSPDTHFSPLVVSWSQLLFCEQCWATLSVTNSPQMHNDDAVLMMYRLLSMFQGDI